MRPRRGLSSKLIVDLVSSSGKSKFADLVAYCSQTDTQHFGRSRAISVRSFEGTLVELTFSFPHGQARFKRAGGRRVLGALETVQYFKPDKRRGRQGKRAAHKVLEFTDVARPNI